MPKKKAWEEHREEIVRLFVQERWTLGTIIIHMDLDKNFHATKPSYERWLRKWGARKNIVGWSTIAEGYEQRRLNGKESKITVGDKNVSTGRVKKAVLRHITTTKALYLKHSKTPVCLELPDRIWLRTPSPGLPNQLVYDDWINASPWLTFLRSTGIQAADFEATLAKVFSSSTMTKATMIASTSTTSNPMSVLDLVFAQKSLASLQEAEIVSATAMRLRSLIPEEYNGQHHKTAKALCDRSRAYPSEEIMIQLFLLANNFTHLSDGVINYPSQDERIVKLLHQLGHNGRQHIKALLSIQNPTADAIKEQLFTSILRSGDLAMLQFILTTGVDLQVVIRSGVGRNGPPLFVVAFNQDEKFSLDAVSLLIDYGADVNYRGDFQTHSVLVPALERGHIAVVNKLIEKGAQACMLSLKFAIDTGDDKVVQKILEAGANVHEYFSIWKMMTPIGLAAQHGHISIAHMLIAKGAALNVGQVIECAVSSGCDHNNYYRSAARIAPLGVAISKGQLEMVELLLEQLDEDANQLSVTQYAWSLLIACDRGHDDIALRLLNAGADVQVADSIGITKPCRETTLLSAIVRRPCGKINIDLCKVLISKGARLDYALLEAARSDNYEFVAFLLSHKAPVKVSDTGVNQTALGCAIEGGAVKMAQCLYGLGVVDAGNPSCIGTVDMVQFLHEAKLLSGILRANGSAIFCNAIRDGGESLVKELMAHDDDIDFSQASGRAGQSSKSILPLDTAICSGMLMLIDYLLKRGATFGRLTLRHAVEHKEHEKILDVLLQSIPDTWGPDDIEPRDRPVGEFDGGEYHEDLLYPPALITAIENGHSSTFHTLLKAVNWGPKRIGKALTAAILYDQIDLVEHLLQAGASLEEEWDAGVQSDRRAVSALGAAVVSQRTELAMRLIKAGANVNKPARNRFSRTALQQAAEIGDLELVGILLEARAEVNAPPAYRIGATALQFAAIRGYREVACKLLHAGANVNAEGPKYYGRTALEGAAENGRLEMVHLLLQSGARLKGIYKRQYLKAVKLARRNGYNAVARFIESVHSTRTEQTDLDHDDNYLSNSDESEIEWINDEGDVEETILPTTGAFADGSMPSLECQQPHEWMEMDQADGVSYVGLPSGANDIIGEDIYFEENWGLLAENDNFMDHCLI